MLALAPFLGMCLALAPSSGATDLILYPNAPFGTPSAIRGLVGENAQIRDLPEIRAFRVRAKDAKSTQRLLARLRQGPFRMVREIPQSGPWPAADPQSVSGLALLKERAELEGNEDLADWYSARQYYISMRAFPYDVPDWQAMRKASEARDRMPAGRIGRPSARQARLAGSPILSNTWSYMGPRNFVNTQGNVVGPPPTTGRVNAAAFDPVDPNVLYAATAGGGVWKTTNGGGTWAPLSDDWECLQTSSIAVDPSNRNRVFVGTGDVPADLQVGVGVMRSEDGGATWRKLSLEARTSGVASILVIPSGKGTLVLASIARGHYGTNGIYRSTDNGDTWTRSPGMEGGSFYMALSAPFNKLGRRYVYAVDMSGRWVYRSADEGRSWDRFQTDRWANGNAASIACSPRSARTIYVMYGTRYSGRSIRGKIWKSTTGGEGFTDITGSFPHGEGDSAWGQPDYNYFLACSTANGQDVVYLGMLSVFVSLDGGGSWRDLGGAYTGSPTTHVDQHCGVVSPHNPNHVLVGNDGGLASYRLNPSSLEFASANLNGNMNCMQFYQVALDPTRPNFLIGGTQDNGTPRVGGDLTAWASVTGGDGSYCAINPRNPDVQFSSAQNLTVYRTDTSWATGSHIGPSLGATDMASFIAPIELDPNDSTTLYGGASHLHRWDDVSRTWTQVTSTRLNTSMSWNPGITAIAVAPGDSDVLYAGTAEGKVFHSEDRGGVWRQINSGFNAITCISVNPYDPHDVVVSLSNSGASRVMRCADTSVSTPSWSNVSGFGPTGLPTTAVNSIVRDPYEWTTTWYVGTDVGVFVTEDAGATWANATAPLGLPNVHVNDLEIGRRTRLLTAGTFGRGIWQVSLSRPPLQILGQIAYGNFSPISPMPDPALQLRNPKSRYVFETVRPKLDTAGQFALEDVPYLEFEVSVKTRSFLRKTIQVNPLALNQFAKLELVNGDVDGDNAIGAKDVSTVLSLQGLKLGDPGYLENADVNGDGMIDVADEQIVKNNLGAIGDL